MTVKLYTRAHDRDLLAADQLDGRFTAGEKSEVSRREAADQYDDYEALMRWYLCQNYPKLTALGFLIRHLDERQLYRVISFGSGPGVLEHLLRLALPPEAEVTATDFDNYQISQVRPLLRNIQFETFDLCNDDIAALTHGSMSTWDVGIFFSSAYVLNDQEMVRLLRQLRGAGIAELIDFHAGFLGVKASMRYHPIIQAIGRIQAVRRVLQRSPGGYQGKMHGYGRSRAELRRLYRSGGYRVAQELRLGEYKYVAILTPLA